MMNLDCECGRKVFVAPHQTGLKVVCPGCGSELQAPLVPFADQAGRLCPLCGGRNWKKIFRPGDLNKILASRTGNFKEYTTFIFLLPRECRQCGTIWFPPVAKWAVFLALVIGVILLGAIALVLLQSRGENLPGFLLMGLGVGALLVAFSFLALTGKMGQATIVFLGKSNERQGSSYS